MMNLGTLQVRTRFDISATHPALPGHFPGAPVVPGVVLLVEAMRQLASRSARSLHIRRIDYAKFLRVVRFGTLLTASLTLDANGSGILELHQEDTLIATARVHMLEYRHEQG